MLSFISVLLVITNIRSVLGCVSGSCTNGMCSDIPSNGQYYLTSFCDSSVACGSWSGNCNEYYMADYSRFGCNSIVSCCKGSDCLNLKVIDGGPGCSVEDSAHKQIVDASYSTCKHFTGSTSCGWSDKILVTCKKTSYTVADLAEDEVNKISDYKPFDAPLAKPSGLKIPLGPCSYNKTFADETGRQMCGEDFDLFFESEEDKKLLISAAAADIIAVAQDEVQEDENAMKIVATNLTSGWAYNAGSSVSWANSYCAKDSEWLCAEFVARALHAGGMWPDVTDYGNYNGYNLKYVPDLHSALKHYGWTQSSSGQWCGSSGQVLIYDNDAHAALAIGNCLLDQHNPSRCGSNAQWDTNIKLYV